MRIAASSGAHLPPAGRYVREPSVAAEEPARTALPAVVPAPAQAPLETPRTRPQAPLLAQLVAAAENLPATRARRRAEPAFGIACYRAMADLAPAVCLPGSRTI